MSHGSGWDSEVQRAFRMGQLSARSLKRRPRNCSIYTRLPIGLWSPPSARMWAKSLLVFKGFVLLYWLWAAKVLILGGPSGFEAIIALSAPLFISFHCLQALLVLRRIKSEQPYWLQLTQTLAFGALYLAPILLQQASKASPASAVSRRS